MLTKVFFQSMARGCSGRLSSASPKVAVPASSFQLSSAFSTVNTTSGPNDAQAVELEKEYASEIKDIWNSYEEKKKRKQSKVGVVVSTKCTKTINVEYAFRKFYPKYNVYMTRHRRLQAHDETEQAREGDVVRIVPSRPYSRTKHHMLIDIIRRPTTASAIPTDASAPTSVAAASTPEASAAAAARS